MRFSYDAETDSLYIHLSERPGADAREVAPDVVADFNEAGDLVGLDLQNASRFVDLSTLEIGALPLTTMHLSVPERAS